MAGHFTIPQWPYGNDRHLRTPANLFITFNNSDMTMTAHVNTCYSLSLQKNLTVRL